MGNAKNKLRFLLRGAGAYFSWSGVKYNTCDKMRKGYISFSFLGPERNVTKRKMRFAMASANDTISRGVIEKVFYENSTYDIVSKVAYLIGVPKHIFENEYEPPKINIFNQLEFDKPTRIVCNLRSCTPSFTEAKHNIKRGWVSAISIKAHTFGGGIP